MKAADLNLDELIDASEGNLNLHGRRLVLHSIHAFGQFRKDILDMLGLDNARRMFTRFGYFWGRADALAMKRLFGKEDLSEWILAGARLHELGGVARVRINKLELDEIAGRFDMDVTWYDSAEAEEHLMEVGRSDAPACWNMIGYASGYASVCMGKTIYFVEHQCQAAGAGFCTAIGKDIDSWGPAIREHLPYFEAEDIKGNVEKLTQQLVKKSKELARHRRQLDLIRRKASPFFTDVRSKSLQQVLDLSRRVAQFDSSLLITGETGVGKEVLARYIHGISHRAKGSFVAINCSALPETLLESELFGYKAGSFTGAVRDRIGMFEQAAGGTLFLDEIGDISQNMQVKILRVLQEKEIIRLGENVPRKIDARVVAATNRNLDKAVSEDKFREDLLYRLRVIEIELPPLRERREDILPLARHFVRNLSKRLDLPRLRLDPVCVDYLQVYPWPGNVRELENALERAAVLAQDMVITPDSLPPHVVRQAQAGIRGVERHSRSLAQVEQEHILAVLQSTGGNRTRTAEILEISPATLWRKLKNYEA